MEQHGKIHGNKPRGKLDLNLENLFASVITLKIAEGELMYGRDICKNPEGYTWSNSTLRYECDETFSDECEFAARAEDE